VPHAWRDEDERACGRVHLLTVELEPRAATMDQVQVFVRVILQLFGSQMTWFPFQLILLIDDSVAGFTTSPCGHAERRDTEVVSDGPPRAAAVADLVDVVKIRRHVIAQGRPLQIASLPGSQRV
jgi:hypothetical protein